MTAGFPAMVGAHYDSDGLIVSFDVPPDIWANIDVTSFGLSAKDGEVQDFVLSPSDALTLGEMGYSVKATVDAEWLWVGVKLAASTTACGPVHWAGKVREACDWSCRVLDGVRQGAPFLLPDLHPPIRRGTHLLRIYYCTYVAGRRLAN